MQQPNNSLWDIGAELECISVQLHQVQNMLTIYDERIEEEINFMKSHQETGIDFFLNRYDLLRSLLEVTQYFVVDISKSLKQQIDAAFEAHMSMK